MSTMLRNQGSNALRVIPEDAPSAASDRVFLFLQGLPGPFFARLRDALEKRGARVLRINFNGGDQLDWLRPGAIAYRGGLAAWRDFLARQLAAHSVTDVVMFNDARPVHAAARALCNARAIPLHVFEDGYLRPNYITLERGGVNRNSPLPRDIAEIMAAAAALPAPPAVTPVPTTFRRRALDGVRYELYAALLHPWYRGYRGHRPLSAIREGKGWLRRLARMAGEADRSRRALAGIGGRRHYILPLQLDADTQLRLYSSYGAMQPALAEVIESFARFAPTDSVLIVKQHPLDSALADWRAISAELARAHGVGDRIIYIERGDINEILRGCAGLVTINSTAGMSALESKVPVFVLGEAVYGIAGIVAAGSLESFWAAPGVVDQANYQALRRLMMHRSLVHGGFHSDAGIQLAVRNATNRLVLGSQ
jgi:capsular polysaccharide export protein